MIDPKNNICVVLKKADGTKQWFYGANIVTNDGDIYYAKRACGETPATDENFGTVASGAGATCILNNPSSADTLAKTDAYQHVLTPIVTSGAQKDASSNYPKTNDGDSDNTGAGTDVVTWLASWTTSDFNATAIIGGCIHVAGGASGATTPGATKLLSHFSLTSFNKTSSDTLKIFVNHTFNGT